jgi:succinate dehydrogenase flavin-adding protein (antitoxin of CptAB toxin-antitoxin module)
MTPCPHHRLPMDATELNRLRWRCRRGMLENDLILARYLDARGARYPPRNWRRSTGCSTCPTASCGI